MKFREFEKYTGLGNDFIITKEKYDDNEIKKICRRRFSIGADGIIFLKFKDGIPFMDYRNSDASYAKMCGNGIRCYTHYLYNNGYIDKSKNNLIIDTLSGKKYIEYHINEKKEFIVKVDMGVVANLELKKKIKILNKEFEYFSLFTGTDHIVIFLEEKKFNKEFVKKYGKLISENKDIFKDGINVNFVNIIDKNNIKLMTFERGCGLTYACGTGAVAASYISNFLGYCESILKVNLIGGILEIEIVKNRCFMKGISEFVYKGRY